MEHNRHVSVESNNESAPFASDAVPGFNRNNGIFVFIVKLVGLLLLKLRTHLLLQEQATQRNNVGSVRL